MSHFSFRFSISDGSDLLRLIGYQKKSLAVIGSRRFIQNGKTAAKM
jgi:hypothetical protein